MKCWTVVHLSESAVHCNITFPLMSACFAVYVTGVHIRDVKTDTLDVWSTLHHTSPPGTIFGEQITDEIVCLIVNMWNSLLLLSAYGRAAFQVKLNMVEGVAADPSEDCQQIFLEKFDSQNVPRESGSSDIPELSRLFTNDNRILNANRNVKQKQTFSVLSRNCMMTPHGFGACFIIHHQSGQILLKLKPCHFILYIHCKHLLFFLFFPFFHYLVFLFEFFNVICPLLLNFILL